MNSITSRNNIPRDRIRSSLTARRPVSPRATRADLIDSDSEPVIERRPAPVGVPESFSPFISMSPSPMLVDYSRSPRSPTRRMSMSAPSSRDYSEPTRRMSMSAPSSRDYSEPLILSSPPVSPRFSSPRVVSSPRSTSPRVSSPPLSTSPRVSSPPLSTSPTRRMASSPSLLVEQTELSYDPSRRDAPVGIPPSPSPFISMSPAPASTFEAMKGYGNYGGMGGHHHEKHYHRHDNSCKRCGGCGGMMTRRDDYGSMGGNGGCKTCGKCMGVGYGSMGGKKYYDKNTGEKYEENNYANMRSPRYGGMNGMSSPRYGGMGGHKYNWMGSHKYTPTRQEEFILRELVNGPDGRQFMQKYPFDPNHPTEQDYINAKVFVMSS